MSLWTPHFNPGMLAAPPSAAADISQVDKWVTSADLQVYTSPTLSFGAAHANRRMYVGFVTRRSGGVTVTSVTIGGVAATLVNQITNGTNRVAMYRAAVPTGTSGVVEVTLSDIALQFGCVLWRVIGAFNTSGTSSAHPNTSTQTVPVNGGALAYVGVTDDTAVLTATWSGLTENVDEAIVGLSTHHAASANIPAGGSTVMTCTLTETPAFGTLGVYATVGPP